MLHIIFIFLSFFCCVQGSCHFYITVFRQLKKEGYHLELSSNIEIVVGSDNCPLWESCTLALVEPLSPSFYLKLNELSRPPLTGCTFNSLDTEGPENKSLPSQVYLYSPLQVTLNLIQAEIRFPLHLRYHSPVHGGGFAKALLGRPKLLLLCNQTFGIKESNIISAPCPVCSKANCNWMELPFQTNSNNFTIPVPVGDLDHLPFVAGFTYFLAIGGCVYLSLAIIASIELK